MRKKDLEYLAEKARVSVSTVSKVIHHCSGVDNITRQTLLDLAEQEKLYPLEEDYKPIHVLLPDNPKYYWNDLTRGIRENCDSSRMKLSIFTRLNDSDVILSRYLQEAQQAHAKLIITAALPGMQCEQQLHQLLPTIPVFLVTETLNLSGSVFFGADGYTDARRLGERFAQLHPERTRILCLTMPNATLHQQRKQGFFSAFPEKFCVGSLPLPHQDPLAAHIARQLYDFYQKTPFDAVYCTDGLMPFVCQSLQKASLADRVICTGHENPKTNQAYFESGLLACTVDQDRYGQGMLAGRCAMEYLETGCLPSSPQIVQSKLCTSAG